MKKIAVLMTCFNRVKTTLACLERLYAQKLPVDYTLDVWLVDDASPDETGKKVKATFPSVKVLQGNGHLFWAGGMRLAWKNAVAAFDYDFYLWLNDDVLLVDGALGRLMSDYDSLPKESIVCGALVAPELGEIFYGAPEIRRQKNIDRITELTHGMHGNVVMIPRCVYLRIGGMAEGLVHQHGDFEYGYRARKNGIRVYAAGAVIGTCGLNYGLTKKRLMQLSLVQRYRALVSPKGIGIMDYCRMKLLTDRGVLSTIGSLLKGCLAATFPKIFYEDRI